MLITGPKNAAYDAVIYHPLASIDSIRVLILEPRRQSDSLKASLKERQLYDDTTLHKALWYCWSVFDLSSSQRIEIQGSAVRISSNLDEALRSLRSEQDQRVLWVDFVCIDQTDLLERVSQINMMGDIYRQATKVVIWLRMPTPHPSWESRYCLSLLAMRSSQREARGSAILRTTSLLR